MNEIVMMPEPCGGGWIMMCPCGTTEIRPTSLKTWEEFHVTPKRQHRYQLACLNCGRSSEYQMMTEDAPVEPHSRVLDTLDKLLMRTRRHQSRACTTMAWVRSGHGRRYSDAKPGQSEIDPN